MAIRDIDKEVQRRHGVKEPGLRWGKSALRVRYGSCPILRHRASRRACPKNQICRYQIVSIWPEGALTALQRDRIGKNLLKEETP